MQAIPKLSLIRVYGIVKTGQLPTIQATYLRYWTWGLFAFMDYGFDKSNQKWIDLRQLKGDNIYTPRPTKQYYEKLLGKREHLLR